MEQERLTEQCCILAGLLQWFGLNYANDIIVLNDNRQDNYLSSSSLESSGRPSKYGRKKECFPLMTGRHDDVNKVCYYLHILYEMWRCFRKERSEVDFLLLTSLTLFKMIFWWRNFLQDDIIDHLNIHMNKSTSLVSAYKIFLCSQ